jgi:lysophospholipid acyltransferase (LPLAT)-like uncharacterized protein
MNLKALRKKLVAALGPWLAYWTIRILGLTMRFEQVHAEVPAFFQGKGIPAIGAFWHGRLLMMPFAYKGKNLSFLVSPHRDGQIVGRALKRFGFRPILGSTHRRGFSGFREMVKAQRDGSDIAVVPDGPRGPRCHAQVGVIELAKLTERPVIPFTFSASRKKILNTWDRFLIPYPFSRGVFVWGEPIHVDPKGDRDHLEERRLLLEKRLNDLTEEADRYFENTPSRER